jgi:hypothetical protein
MFQNAVAAATRPASRLETALNPIVTVRTRAGSPPTPRTVERSTASSLGTPVTPTRRPSRARGDRTPRAAMTDASGRWMSAATPTTSAPCSRASARSWMSSTARSARPAASNLSASAESAGVRTSSRTPSRRS